MPVMATLESLLILLMMVRALEDEARKVEREGQRSVVVKVT